MTQFGRILLTGLLSVLMISAYSQNDKKNLTKAEKKAKREQVKEEEKKHEEAQWISFQNHCEEKTFIIELKRVTDNRTGKTYDLNQRTNFVSVNNDKVVIQLETNEYLASNGLGGVTIDGRVTDYKYDPPVGKRGAISVSFNVSSQTTFKGSNVSITVGKGGYSTLTIGRSPMIYGEFFKPQDSGVWQGGSFRN